MLMIEIYIRKAEPETNNDYTYTSRTPIF